MNYQGDYPVGAEVTVWFNTFDSNDPSASVTVTNLIDTDIHIFKDDGLTQRTNAAGTAVDVDVDTYVGVHKLTINTADNTVNDFFEAGHDYAVVVEGITIDAGQVSACVGTFSIANRRVAGQMCISSIEALTDQSNFTLTTGEASADNDAYNGCTIIVTDQVTKIQKAIGHISDYVGATRAVVLYAAPLQTAFTMAIGDSVEIIATSVFANVNTIGLTAQTANDNGADINSILTGTVTNAQGADVASDVAAMIDGNNRVDVGSWLGTAVTLGNGLPDVNVDSIDDTAIAGIATAGKLHVLDDAGATVATEAKQDIAQTELDKIGTIPSLDTAAQTIGAAIGKLADDNAGATFDAGTDSLNKIRDDRTLPAADYTVVGDTIARVTLVDTVTDNTDLVTADEVWDAVGADTSLSFETLLERAYQFFVNELRIVDATGGATLRDFGDVGNMATWTISDDDTTTDRTAIIWA